jgi:nickel and cobalt resistance protein CnrR
VSPFWRNLLVTVLVAGIAAYVGAWAGSMQQHRGGATKASPLRDAIHAMADQGLKLTPAQQKSIDEIDARYNRRREALRAQIARANVEVADALAVEMAFGPKAELAINHLQSTVGELQKATILYVLEVRETLTLEQKSLYDDKVIEALTAEPL